MRSLAIGALSAFEQFLKVVGYQFRSCCAKHKSPHLMGKNWRCAEESGRNIVFCWRLGFYGRPEGASSVFS
jgi:hypothetical protein